MTDVHKEYHGRKVQIPNPRPGWTNPFAGKIGDVQWAGWEDWYTIHVDNVYFARERADEVARYLVPEEGK